MNLENGGTTIERNGQIGGHKGQSEDSELSNIAPKID